MAASVGALRMHFAQPTRSQAWVDRLRLESEDGQLRLVHPPQRFTPDETVECLVKSLSTRSAPPELGTAGSATRSGSGTPSRSGLAAQRPLSAVPQTFPRATASIDDAAYVRSLTYCERANASPPNRLARTRPIGSTSSSSAAVQRSSLTSG